MGSNYLSGHAAERDAAEYLKQNGYEVLELNWKTRNCEIDIIAQKGKTIFFVEVKSRRANTHGSALDYVTPSKQKQMKYAADTWCTINHWQGECRLAAIGITADDILYTDEIWV